LFAPPPPANIFVIGTTVINTHFTRNQFACQQAVVGLRVPRASNVRDVFVYSGGNATGTYKTHNPASYTILCMMINGFYSQNGRAMYLL
jgi:hypothetical protein